MTAQPAGDQTIHVINLDIHNGETGKHVDWLARMMMAGIDGYAVLSSEIIPPDTHEKSDWTLVQRFRQPEDIETWRSSKHRQTLLTELQPHLDKKDITFLEEDHSTFGSVGNVAIAIVTHVKPGHESQYLHCEHKLQIAQSNRPGYRGAYIQPPTSGTAGIWTSIIRFDNTEALDLWINSDVRKKLLSETKDHVESWDYQMVDTSYPGFFSGKGGGGKGPPNWKTAMLIQLGLYPIVMLELRLLMPHLGFLPNPMANFIAMVISVIGTTWLTMPASIKVFSSWLFPTDKTPRWVAPASVAAIICLYAIEIFLFWRSF